jgi:hypothetical protein
VNALYNSQQIWEICIGQNARPQIARNQWRIEGNTHLKGHSTHQHSIAEQRGKRNLREKISRRK